MKTKMLIVLFAAGVAVMGCSSTQNTSGNTDTVSTPSTLPTPTDTTTTDTSTTDTSSRDSM
jgi:hypothetical protein